jgi:hypothetical protein
MSLSTIDTRQMVTYPGAVLQVVQAVKTDTSIYSTSSWVDLDGLSVTITPATAGSRILLSFHVSATAYQRTVQLRLTRNGTAIGVGGASSSRVQTTVGSFYNSTDTNHQTTPHSAVFLDSPSTSAAVTYKVQIKVQYADPCYINRSSSDADNSDWAHRSTSGLTAMEIAG